jgi:quercetin dioxygenase-like cupin family protein
MTTCADSTEPGEHAMKERVLIKPPVDHSRYLDSGALDWEETEHEGFYLKRLYEDEARGEKTWLMRIEPGASAPSHDHDEFEQFYVLEGDIRDDNGSMQAGDFVCRPPGEMHWTASDSGALVLLVYTRR